MIMTLRQYLSNPQGKGSAASAIKQWKAEYDPRYDTLLEKHGKFEMDVFKTSNSRVYFVHVKIPSETYDDVIYDAVFKFDSKGKNGLPLQDWPVRAIANAPSFVYTYENVFRRNNILVEELKNRLPDESYTEKPKTRNPYSIVGYEKTVYYAARYLTEKYASLSWLDGTAKKLDLRALRDEFGDFNKVMDKLERERKKRVEANRQIRKQKKRRMTYQDSSKTLPPKQEIDARARVINRTGNRISPLKPVGRKGNRVQTVKKI